MLSKKYKKQARRTRKRLIGGTNGIGILMGRFQPFHKAHLQSVLIGLRQEDIFIVGVGQDGINIKNPYTVEERMRHIIGSVLETAPELLSKLRLIVLPESPIDDNWTEWDGKINILLGQLMKEYTGKQLYLYAAGKDKTTADYLKKIVDQNPGLLPKTIDVVSIGDEIVSATTIRVIMNKFSSTIPLDYSKLISELTPYLPTFVLYDIICKRTIESI